MTDLYFYDYKFAIDIDGNGHSDRNIDYEMKRQKVIEPKLRCELMKIDPNKEKYLGTSNNHLINWNRRTKQNRLILVSNYVVCGKKKLRFFKNQETSALLDELGIRISLSSISLISDILF